MWGYWTDFFGADPMGRKAREKQLNEFDQYKVKIQSEGVEHEIHFVALISERQDAVPIVFLHGWPGIYFLFDDLQSLD